jgi:hypothetical protein
MPDEITELVQPPPPIRTGSGSTGQVVVVPGRKLWVEHFLVMAVNEALREVRRLLVDGQLYLDPHSGDELTYPAVNHLAVAWPA